MAKYLTQEWLDQSRELAKDQPERAGASAKMQYVVTGGPDGDVKYYWVLENGKLLESQLGEIADADFTMTLDVRRLGRRSRRASSTRTRRSCRDA